MAEKIESFQIYAMAHKAFEVPPDALYCPLQVGSALHEDLGYLRDDTGDNISERNCYYSELTGLYWIWKNQPKLDYVGTCHYRRFLINEQEKIFSRSEYETLLQQYDLITTKKVHLNNSYHYGFSANHNIAALDMTGEVIKELYPKYYDTYIRLVHGPDTYFGNMFVTSKTLYDEYCNWLFSIFFQVEQRINPKTEEDDYHKRVFGFISEFLLLVWVTVKKLRVYECKVGMVGEKVETRQMKQKLAQYLKRHDVAGAKAYFLEQHSRRPDLLMEASDITGELHLILQMIATADAEMKTYGKSFLDVEDSFERLIPHFTALNQAVIHQQNGQTTQQDIEYRNTTQFSEIAIKIAELLFFARNDA